MNKKICKEMLNFSFPLIFTTSCCCCWLGLVLFALLALTLQGAHADLFVVLLESSQMFTGLGELSLLHALADVPVDKGTLGVHEIKLVIEPGPGLGNGSGVAQHADSSGDLGQISTRDDCGWLVVDAHPEAGRTPVHKMDGPLCLDGGNSCIDILGDDIASIQHAAGHVLSVTRVTLDHLVGRLEAGVGDLGHRQLLVVSLLS